MDSDGAPYEQIAADLRRRIVARELAPGDRVPSTRALVTEHGVAMATAARALTLLRDQGWVRTVPRVGTVVADAPPGASRAVRGVRGPSRRPPARGPDRADVVAVAIDLADVDGLGALSMRRVASVVGVPTMSLYGLVRSRDDLLLAMIETVFAAEPLPSPRGPWRARLEEAARIQWRAHQRHSWLARVMSLSRPQPVPALLRLAEAELAALEEIEPDPTLRFDLHVVLTSFVRGMAVDLAAEVDAETDTGIDADTWADRDPALRETLERHAGPALRRVGDYPYDLQRIFDTGLVRLLDGIGRGAG